MHLLGVLVFLQTEKTDFAALPYISTSEIPTLSCTRNLKKVPLSGGASPHILLWGVPHGFLSHGHVAIHHHPSPGLLSSAKNGPFRTSLKVNAEKDSSRSLFP